MNAAGDLQRTIVPWLKGDAGVAEIVGARVYDDVPRSETTGSITAQFPFLAIADWQEITEDADCIGGAEITITIDAWSRAVGSAEVHRLAAAVKGALHNADLSLSDNALVSIEHLTTRTLRDPDGISRHAVIEFRALVETP